MFLLDTPVLAELEKPHPNPGVVEWFTSVEWVDLHLSAISVAEIWQGIARLPAGRKRRALEAFFGLLPDEFNGRILPVDFQVGVKMRLQTFRRKSLDCLDIRVPLHPATHSALAVAEGPV